MEVKWLSYSVDVFTSQYRASGELRTLGGITSFLNDPRNSTLIVKDAAIVPLRPGVSIEARSADVLHIPRREAQIVIIGHLTPDIVKPLPHRVKLILLIDLFTVQGWIHTGVDTQIADIFTATPGPFLFCSGILIESIYAEGVAVHAGAGLAYLNADAVLGYIELPND